MLRVSAEVQRHLCLQMKPVKEVPWAWIPLPNPGSAPGLSCCQGMAGRGMHWVCVSVICWEPGEVAPVVCTAPQPGLEGIPAARESTAVHKGIIPVPSSLWSQILIICQAQPSATEASPALHGVSSEWLNHRVGSEIRVRLNKQAWVLGRKRKDVHSA